MEQYALKSVNVTWHQISLTNYDVVYLNKELMLHDIMFGVTRKA